MTYIVYRVEDEGWLRLPLLHTGSEALARHTVAAYNYLGDSAVEYCEESEFEFNLEM